MKNLKNLLLTNPKSLTFVLVLMLAMPMVLSAQSISAKMEIDPVVNAHSQTGIELIQNKTNPLNTTSSFDFRIPSDSKVSIKICDANNVEVITLLDDELSAGTHTVQFYFPAIKEGSYYYNLSVQSGGLNTVIKEQMQL